MANRVYRLALQGANNATPVTGMMDGPLVLVRQKAAEINERRASRGLPPAAIIKEYRLVGGSARPTGAQYPVDDDDDVDVVDDDADYTS